MTCAKCNDFSRLSFDDGALTQLAITVGGTLFYYPRETGNVFAYTVGSGNENKVFESTSGNSPHWKDGVEQGSSINDMPSSSLAGELVPANAQLLSPADLTMPYTIYSATRNGASGIFAGQGAKTFSILPGVAALQTSYKEPAAAWNVNRLYLTQTAGQETDLVFVTLPGMITQKVTPKLDNGCLGLYPGFAPWVDPAGKVLLFSQQAPDGGCGFAQPDAKQLRPYIVLLDVNGAPVSKAARLLPALDAPMYSPSLSSDQCGMFFAKDDGNATHLYYAPRN
jgi:hypothetical protein